MHVVGGGGWSDAGGYGMERRFGGFDYWCEQLLSPWVVGIFAHQKVTFFTFLHALELGSQWQVIGMKFSLVFLTRAYLRVYKR